MKVAARNFTAQVVSNNIYFRVPDFPQPCMKGDSISIKISEDEYTKELKNKPPTAKQLHETLIPLWKINSWKLVMLDKGFFEFVFSNIEEMRSVWSTGSWNLKFEIICFACHNGFRISALTLRNNIIQKTLIEIVGVVGMPITLDEPNINRVFGHYAMLLVEVDLSKPLHDNVLVEREGKTDFNCDEASDTNLVDTFFFEKLHEEVVPKDHAQVDLGRSIVVTDSNMSNFSENVIHDIKVLGLAPTVAKQTMDFLSDSWTNMGQMEDIVDLDPNQQFQLLIPKKKNNKLNQ
ncbi:hypothetical protein MTR_8g022850 [Medicago truncatula]|uniref:DUF4283 domain protein n=1 Tax=Medicago truncatula TaxID=3880 RepID=G7L944_MEDTR|nr:hypothetical protein MTR_8g022850 [Medicago truncatula]